MKKESRGRLLSREERVMRIFEQLTVVEDRHTILTHGRHSLKYVEKTKFLTEREAVDELCSMLADDFRDDQIDFVIGPVAGGILLADSASKHLSNNSGRKVLGIWADKDGKNFKIRPAFKSKIKDSRVLVVEDIFTTGESLERVVEAVREAQGNVIGVGVICNRGEADLSSLGVGKISTLVTLNIPSYSEEECPARNLHS